MVSLEIIAGEHYLYFENIHEVFCFFQAKYDCQERFDGEAKEIVFEKQHLGLLIYKQHLCLLLDWKIYF